MIDLATLVELRETRRRLAEQHGQDAQRYAAMLALVSRTCPCAYVEQPLLPQTPAPVPKAKAS